MEQQSNKPFTYKQENIILLSGIGFAITGFIWGIVYFLLGETTVGFIPISFSIFLIIPLLVYVQTKSVAFFLHFQLIELIIIPFAMHIVLGGFHSSSLVILWGLVPTFVTQVLTTKKQASIYLLTFIVFVIAGILIQPNLTQSTSLSPTAITAFYYLNVGVVGSILLFTAKHIQSKKTKPQ